MKAVIRDNYGSPDVLRMEEVEKPIPGDDEVLVKVQAASLNPFDRHHMRGKPFLVRLSEGLRKPKRKIIGADMAGRVEAAGVNVKQFQPGEEIWGCCEFGAFAEYVCIPESKIVLKPAGMTFEEAASFPIAALSALQGLRDRGKIRSGQKVLINGAAGGVGTFAVQIAKYFGAEVTGVCSAGNLDRIRALGADHVIDYNQEDFTGKGTRYDLIYDAVGNRSFFELKRTIKPKGICVIIGYTTPALPLQVLFLGPWLSITGGKKISIMVAKTIQQDLAFLNELFEAGKVKPVIDRRYPLSETAEAIRYLEEGHARGKVVITV